MSLRTPGFRKRPDRQRSEVGTSPLGCQRGTGRTQWKLGTAKVHLIKVGRQLKRQPQLLRSGHLRSPLAYQQPDLASYREQEIRARKADLDIRRAVARLDSAGRKREIPKKANLGLVADRLMLAVARRWVDLRATRPSTLRSPQDHGFAARSFYPGFVAPGNG